MVEDIEEVRERMATIWPMVREHMAEAQTAQARVYNRGAQPREFAPGDRVLVSVPTSECKFLAKWNGPYEVIEKVGTVNYRVAVKTEPVEVPMGEQLTPSQRQDLQDLVNRNRDVFYRGGAHRPDPAPDHHGARKTGETEAIQDPRGQKRSHRDRGVVSLISLAVLSYERYCTMVAPTEADATNYRKIGLGIGLSWAYSLMWTVPPLFGWSRYGPEGPGTTCSVNWTAKNANNISYIICLFFFCLILPFIVIVYSYAKLLHIIKEVSGVNSTATRKREQRVLVMVITMVICYLLCWLPYGIMALLATFGPPGLVTPEASIIPSILAKTSTVINPIIYIFMNKQTHQRGSSFKSSSKPFRIVRNTNDNNLTLMVASTGHPSTSAPNPSNSREQRASLDMPKPAVVSLVAHYNS
ncbi:hypothetical protein SKAU_G00198430 [Synaphobranchus kaupii]|uniref:G-protein coupled receptors family 1 profile domain-containing protein n=1 Tax=Synaphobranchus kaupii TaxID=118154 RepID=A0A9Q1FF22_SYNKA|nr:hypothetical protein SKAU_G00198430 [Synaphobranchus kaupii]